jgi:dihydrofolate reductase
MKVALIWAMSENRVIGRDGGLPWRIAADLAHFKQTTVGHTIIMGRKTWESLPRALAERRNLVISRQADYRAEGAEVFGDFDAALAACEREERVFIVGGAAIYEMALPLADELFVTFVHAEVVGDTEFPEFDLAGWVLEDQRRIDASAENEFACTIAKLVRGKRGKKRG